MKKHKNKEGRIYKIGLPVNFFDRKQIILLGDIPSGNDFVVLYIKLLMLSATTDGYLYYDQFESSPEDELAAMLRLDRKWMKAAVTVLRNLRLLDILQDGTIFLPEAKKVVESETVAAAKMRLLRNKRKEEKLIKSSGQNLLAVPENDVDSQKVKDQLNPASGLDSKELIGDKSSQCYDDVKHCYNKVITMLQNVTPVDNSGLTGMIPDRTNNNQKVKELSKPAPELDLDADATAKMEQKHNKVITMLQNVTPVDNLGLSGTIPERTPKFGRSITTVKLLPGEVVEPSLSTERNNLNNSSFGKFVNNHPSIQETDSSLKSEESSNNNREAHARARLNNEENPGTDGLVPDRTPTDTGRPVTGNDQTLDGWMDGFEKSPNPKTSMSGDELENVFQVYMVEYPRHGGKEKLIRKAFRELVYLKKVDPYDLVDAAKKYAEKVREEKTPDKFIKMSLNFLEESVWMRYVPVYRKHCPKCHGKGMFEDVGGGGMVFCDCVDRYKGLVPKIGE